MSKLKGTLEPTQINPDGPTPCLIRWMVETEAGWLGAWDREAFDAYAAARIAEDHGTNPWRPIETAPEPPGILSGGSGGATDMAKCRDCALWDRERAMDRAGRIRKNRAVRCLWVSTEVLPLSVRKEYHRRPTPSYMTSEDGAGCPCFIPVVVDRFPVAQENPK